MGTSRKATTVDKIPRICAPSRYVPATCSNQKVLKVEKRSESDRFRIPEEGDIGVDGGREEFTYRFAGGRRIPRTRAYDSSGACTRRGIIE
jgi:hypothetical protein